MLSPLPLHWRGSLVCVAQGYRRERWSFYFARLTECCLSYLAWLCYEQLAESVILCITMLYCCVFSWWKYMEFWWRCTSTGVEQWWLPRITWRKSPSLVGMVRSNLKDTPVQKHKCSSMHVDHESSTAHCYAGCVSFHWFSRDSSTMYSSFKWTCRLFLKGLIVFFCLAHMRTWWAKGEANVTESLCSSQRQFLNYF